MKVIYKFPLKFGYVNDRQKILMPKNPRILKVDEQDEVLTLWALVDTDNDDEYIKVEIIPTGTELPELGGNEIRHHLDTVVMSCGLVWHVFQLLKVSPKV